jgi:hypothetical protein
MFGSQQTPELVRAGSHRAGLRQEVRRAVSSDDDDVLPLVKREVHRLRVMTCSQHDVVSALPEVLDDRRE